MAYTYDDFMEITDWYSLRDFCWENRLKTNYNNVDLDEIVDDYWVKERVTELANDCQWNEIYRLVYSLDDSTWEDGIYFDRGDGLEVLDYDYFEETRDEVLTEFRDEGYHFEDEDEDEDEEEDISVPTVSRYSKGVKSVYGRVFVQASADQPDITGCSAEDFGRFFGV